ncbi:hypothetical protein CLV29_1727 [Naumannella halotolerans]|uniref:Uncharacterized protein n=1 Tax=Naumannella halotolerans TaxID=993414 RepID=A0A4R7JAX6_9ACTN|nr:hypothetical protein CLV29_1727 [Naumannella halotolerans]
MRRPGHSGGVLFTQTAAGSRLSRLVPPRFWPSGAASRGSVFRAAIRSPELQGDSSSIVAPWMAARGPSLPKSSVRASGAALSHAVRAVARTGPALRRQHAARSYPRPQHRPRTGRHLADSTRHAGTCAHSTIPRAARHSANSTAPASGPALSPQHRPRTARHSANSSAPRRSGNPSPTQRNCSAEVTNSPISRWPMPANCSGFPVVRNR